MRARIKFLLDVGLDYLTLSRSAATLAGEKRNAFDSPPRSGPAWSACSTSSTSLPIGLHQRDNERLIETLLRLRDMGNTLIVVEHDEDTIRVADHILDIGPGAGEHGGDIVAQGTLADITKAQDSITGDYLAGRRQIPVPLIRRPGNGEAIRVLGATENNLQGLDVDFPLGVFTAVTGVSGSGKSTLIEEILWKTLANRVNRARVVPGRHKRVEGIELIDKVIDIDQSPIGRTPRSNPATYTKLFDHIRALYSQTNEARARGYKQGRFSFNVRGGRCEACSGDGTIKIEMHFLPDVYVPCEVCAGKRYNRETLEILWKGHNISEVLEMSVEEALGLFENQPEDCPHPADPLRRRSWLRQTWPAGDHLVRWRGAEDQAGFGTGEAVDRPHLLHPRRADDRPPFRGHPQAAPGVAAAGRCGNTVVVIEHNLDVVKSVDHVIDLGPEGGSGGGRIIATGTPEEVAQVGESYTGKFLRELVGG